MNLKRINSLLESVKSELKEATGPYANAQKMALQAVEALLDGGLTVDARKVKSALPVRDQASAMKVLKELDLAAKSALHLGQDDALEVVSAASDAVQQAADFMVQKGLEQPVAKTPKSYGAWPESIIVRIARVAG
jgi:hypothetical protein